MILLNKIKLTNFLSHALTEVEFSNEQKLLISGNSGSGKSSIIDAIIWALYNQGRSDNRSLIRRGASTARVVLFINDDDISYKIERSINRAGKHEFDLLKKEEEKWVPLNISGIKNNQDFLENKILKSSYLLFINSIAYPQDNQENFIRQTAAKRKDILLEIIKANSYDEYYALAKDKLSKINSEISSLNSLVGEKMSSIQVDKVEAEKLPTLIEECALAKKELNEIKEKIKKSEEADIKNKEIKFKVESIDKEVTSLENEIKEKESSMAEREKEIADVNNIDVEVLKVKVNELIVKRMILGELEKAQGIHTEWSAKMVELLRKKPSNNLIELGTEMANLNDELIRIMSSKVELCPELNKSCPVSQRHKDEKINNTSTLHIEKKKIFNEQKIKINEFELRAKELGPEPIIEQSKIIETKEIIVALELYEKQFVQYQGLKETIKTRTEQIGMLVAAISGIKERIKILFNDKSSLGFDVDPFAAGQKNSYLTQQEKINERYMDLTKRVAIAEVAERRMGESEKSIVDEKQKISEVELNKENVELIKEAFSTNGIKALITDMIIPQLEDRINTVLSSLSNFRIKLETQRDAISSESVIEGLFIDIINDQGETFDLENFSGGEKTKIITAISEGLASMQNVGFRLLDEHIVGLDSETIEGFVGAMASIRHRFNQLICISHISQIAETFEDVIHVTKKDGVSTIQQ